LQAESELHENIFGGNVKALILAVLSGVLLSPAQAKHWHDDDDDHHGKKHRKHDDDCYFRAEDRRVIVDYYAPRVRDLPPGLRKKYYRTGHLPPGWARRIEPVPVYVERQLPPIPPDYRRGFIDGNVVVYNPRTQVMIDVVAVFGGR